ncbi:MAG: hypothetical protein ACP5QO_10125, partial [Clostridia bacterium]
MAEDGRGGTELRLGHRRRRGARGHLRTPSLDTTTDALRQVAIDVGPDVRLEPRSTFTPFIRHRKVRAIKSP